MDFFRGVETRRAHYYWGHYWHVVTPDNDGWCWVWSNRYNDWQEKPKYSKKICPSSASSTTNPTLPYPGSIPGRRYEKPATNRLSYSTAFRYNCNSIPLCVVPMKCDEMREQTDKRDASGFLDFKPLKSDCQLFTRRKYSVAGKCRSSAGKEFWPVRPKKQRSLLMKCQDSAVFPPCEKVMDTGCN
jgi:hypothetical protein